MAFAWQFNKSLHFVLDMLGRCDELLTNYSISATTTTMIVMFICGLRNSLSIIIGWDKNRPGEWAPVCGFGSSQSEKGLPGISVFYIMYICIGSIWIAHGARISASYFLPNHSVLKEKNFILHLEEREICAWLNHKIKIRWDGPLSAELLFSINYQIETECLIFFRLLIHSGMWILHEIEFWCLALEAMCIFTVWIYMKFQKYLRWCKYCKRVLFAPLWVGTFK
jgi:hypothetical protein